MQTYRPVPGLENYYSISESGHVIRTSAQRGTIVGKTIKGSLTKRGYWKVRLTNGIKAKGYFVHRLVCFAWHPNPLQLPQVNHKDTNKLNNHFTNLEWCSNQTNKDHAMANGIIPKGWKGKFGKDHNRTIDLKGVNVVTGEEKIFHGSWEASRHINCVQGSIANVISGRNKTIKNWKFEQIL